MRRYLRFTPLFLLLFVFGCQKETSFEQGKSSSGSLQNASGDCLAKTVAGTYTAGEALGDTNYIDVTVDVTETGNFSIHTDTVNGYFFMASGNFTSTGTASVRLKGSGTPASAGTDNFFVYYDSSFCSLSVTVLPGSGSSGGTASYTLNGTGGNCLNYTTAGTFTQGVALTSANTVTLEVDVTKVGSWSITTAAVAGFAFSGSGTFTATGVQTITLTGSGTPNAAGDQNFAVSAGTSSCSFTITVDPGNNPPASDDYFPRTANSNWGYEVDDDLTDTLLRLVIPQTLNVAGNTYNIFAITDDASQGYDSSGYYRKSGGNYYEWIDAAGELGFDNEQWIEYIFLKDDQPANTSWYSPTINGTAQGNSYVVRNKFTIIQKDVSVSVNGFTYPNTIVVQQTVEQNAGSSWVDISSTVGSLKVYYAKGVGMIKQEFTDPTGTTKIELRRSQVF